MASGGGMMEPYKNVVRMHVLIFFFAFAHFARLENFFVYAVVYAVYFFPWRLVQRTRRSPLPAAVLSLAQMTGRSARPEPGPPPYLP